MIQTEHLEKSFGSIMALSDISLTIAEEQVFGLIGTNGAGKSTFLRLISGVLKPDYGVAAIDGQVVFDNPAIKRNLFFIPDEPYFFPNASAEDMKDYYLTIYENFDAARFDAHVKNFGLDPKRSINQYSKGMKKQLAVICGISAGTKYLFCDETFDGLDPVMRQSVKSLFAGDMAERGLTPVIASHNLRELEDICDHVGLLHRGGLLLSEDLEEMKLGLQKLQFVLPEGMDAKAALEGLTVVSHGTRGRMHTLVARSDREALLAHFQGVETIYLELLPLTLEEIFINETEVAGYDVRKFILN